ncbi:vWA domain-containing protein [Ktedonosporobacter rubrisoli]|nr:vWA domain-containing protein [Ktedonosporobacter rubrisoli]
MFTITAHYNQYLPVGQNSMQAILSLEVSPDVQASPSPLTLAIALDHSGSMEGSRLRSACEATTRVIQALDGSITFMLIAFNHKADSLYGPAMATATHKRQAIEKLRRVKADMGTRMSTALNLITEKLGKRDTHTRKVLFLTDGKNEGEARSELDQAIARCAAANVSIHAWGIGTDWDEKELRHMADATHGVADMIPNPAQIAQAFSGSFQEIRTTVLANACLYLWTPMGVSIKKVEQVHPNIVASGLEADPANPRQQVISLGSFTKGERRDYLIELALPAYTPDQQFLVLRPSIAYYTGQAQEVTEKSTRQGWVFAQCTQNSALAAQLNPHVAHYIGQEALAQAITEGQEALAAGDTARATRVLGRALEISERSGNERITRLLSAIVQRDARGTIQLSKQADIVATKKLALNIGHTSKLK